MKGFESGGVITREAMQNAGDKILASNGAGGEMIMTGQQILTLWALIGEPCPHGDLKPDAYYFISRDGIKEIENEV